jgi:hypothetical protein
MAPWTIRHAREAISEADLAAAILSHGLALPYLLNDRDVAVRGSGEAGCYCLWRQDLLEFVRARGYLRIYSCADGTSLVLVVLSFCC